MVFYRRTSRTVTRFQRDFYDKTTGATKLAAQCTVNLADKTPPHPTIIPIYLLVDDDLLTCTINSARLLYLIQLSVPVGNMKIVCLLSLLFIIVIIAMECNRYEFDEHINLLLKYFANQIFTCILIYSLINLMAQE